MGRRILFDRNAVRVGNDWVSLVDAIPRIAPARWDVRDIPDHEGERYAGSAIDANHMYPICRRTSKVSNQSGR